MGQEIDVVIIFTMLFAIHNLAFAFFSLVILILLILNVRDGKRAKKHYLIAKLMVENGMSEEKAMEMSGCNYWGTVWYKRIFTNYPSINESMNLIHKKKQKK